MVPATTERDIEQISQQLGLVDLGAVTTERHRSWVMTDDESLLPLAEVGVELVDDIAPFERRKLWLLNGPHSALAYCGLLAGCTTIAEATRHPIVSAFVRRLVDDVLEVAELPASLQPRAFAAEALARFGNPSLGHTCAQVGADGSRKLPQRFGSIVAARERAGLETTRFATVVAIWIAAASGLPLGGGKAAIVEDPASVRLRSVAATSDLRQLAHLALDDWFAAEFVSAVVDTLARLLQEGMRTPRSGARMIVTIGAARGDLEVRRCVGFVQSRLAELDLDGRSLCLVIPDATRNCPLPCSCRRWPRPSRPCPFLHGGRRSRHPRADVRRSHPCDGRSVRFHRGEPRLVGDTPSPASAPWARTPCPNSPRDASTRRSTSGSTDWSSRVTSQSLSGRCSRTRSSGSPGGTSTSSPGCRARSSST